MTDRGATTERRPKRLLGQVREKLRTMHYSYRTEQAYLDWIKRYILFHGKRHPRDMGPQEIEAFVSHLANDRGVSASTQTQALSAVLFLYRYVLEVDVGWIEGVTRAKKSQRVPVVLTREEVAAVLARMQGRERLMAALMYGTGLRVMECGTGITRTACRGDTYPRCPCLGVSPTSASGERPGVEREWRLAASG